MTATFPLPLPLPLAQRPAPAARYAVPLPALAVPPGREVPSFPPIRRGGTGRYRLAQALRQRSAVLAVGLLLAAAALTAGVPRAGLPPPGATPIHHSGCQPGELEDHP